MLSRLHVMNYALIDDLEIEFSNGLNIITGETGAGKSILVGALGLILGTRASAEVIRTGEEKCIVEAIFTLHSAHPCLSPLEEMGIDTDGGTLILRREVLAEGRSRCFVNGLAIPVRALHDLGRMLVDLHGQHDHQSLLNADQHLDFLDGSGDLTGMRRQVEALYGSLVALQKGKVEKEAVAHRQRERRELLEYQVEEIDSAAIKPGEDDALDQERSVLSNAERLTEIALHLESILYEGEDSIADGFGKAGQLMDEAARLDKTLAPRGEELDGLRYGVEELARSLSDYAQGIEHNPERLAEVNDRLEVLTRLRKKYGGDLDSVLSYQQGAQKELALTDELDAALRELEIEIDRVLAEFTTHCIALSRARQKVGKKLAKQICGILGELGMPDVQFEVRLAQNKSEKGFVSLDGELVEASARGIDHGEFFLSTNPGEVPRALVKVASGGEISRIMLAMKTALVHTDSVQVLIFEIDIGISGRIAEVVGKKLKALSESYQTISITHLPQIAKMAEKHFSVRKETQNRRTVTRVVPLDREARAEELAKMMGGEEISELTRQHAREMLTEKN
ncbi:MAG: DNA repair protein RecN [bacterium]|nr:DNA repair protein RecN [bacterium]